MVQENWDFSGRDVVPDLTPIVRPRDAGGAIMLSLLRAEGIPWGPPYEEFRRILGVRKRTKPVEPLLQEQADSRLRTYLVLFRGMGLVYEAGGTVHVTALGRELLDLLEQQYSTVDAMAVEIASSTRRRIAALVAPALGRYLLCSPLSEDYPSGTDIHPLRAIWRAMRALDDRIHWDELDRTLTKCLSEASVDGAIAAIQDARATPGYNPADSGMLETLLGPRAPEVSDQADRVDVWLSRAGFKNLFIEQRDRPDGYRYLSSEFIDIIDEILDGPAEAFTGTTAGEYVEWVGEVINADGEHDDHALDDGVQRIVERCERWGDKRIITLVGPAGSGKTRTAHRAARALAGGDTSRVSVVQFHAAFTYEEFVGGFSPAPGGGFQPSEGVLLQINDMAKADPENTYVLLIDELSRADVANVLGELLTYVEYRDRWFSVPSLNRTDRIASNLFILATMNPADRSVVDMDDALVRRLIQIEIPKSSAALREILTANGCEEALIGAVAAWFEGLPEDTPFAHGLFVGVRNEADLYELWHEQLKYFLRRGGLATYPNPEAIEDGYIWRYLKVAGKQSADEDGEDEPPTAAPAAASS